MVIKIGVLKNYANLTGKHLCWIDLQLYEKETPTQVFSCKICEIFMNTFFYRISPVAASEAVLIVKLPKVPS